jgi:hypothetical protein
MRISRMISTTVMTVVATTGSFLSLSIDMKDDRYLKVVLFNSAGLMK